MRPCRKRRQKKKRGYVAEPPGKKRGYRAADGGRRRGVAWCAQATTSQRTPEKQKRAARSSAENRLSPKGGPPRESLCV
jgi:hypothetical protein